MAGERIIYFTVEKDDRYYKAHKAWTLKEYDAAMMTQETAEKVCRRYPGSVVSKGYGYDIWFKRFEDLEPDSVAALSSAVKLAARDGISLQTILVQVEKAFYENGNAKAV